MIKKAKSKKRVKNTNSENMEVLVIKDRAGR